MIDIERLDRALARIAAKPETHHQGAWIIELHCGTGGCLAGHVVLDAHPGAKPARFDGVDFIDDSGEEYKAYTHVLLPDGTELSVRNEAARLLGLTDGFGLIDTQASALFAGGNTLEVLRRMRDMLAADPGVSGSELVGVWASLDGDGERAETW